MNAIVVMSPGDIRMIETDKPKVGPTDVLVKVKYTGICGTDLAILSGDMSFVRDGLIKYPVRIGHEWSGIVEEIGVNVEDIKVGDRIVADNGVTCGKCEPCKSKDYAKCIDMHPVGTVNAWDGSFAEYMLIPQWHVYKLPETITLEDASLIEPTTIAFGGVEGCNINSKSKVLIIGTGAIGLAAVALAKYMGADKVILCGRKDYKLKIGKQMGADVVINNTKEDLRKLIDLETDGIGVDAIIETSGNIETLHQCIDVASTNCIISLISFYEKELNNFNIDKLVINGIQLKGTVGSFGAPKKIIDIMTDFDLKLDLLITHRFKFNEVIEAMKTADEKNETKIKMLCVM